MPFDPVKPHDKGSPFACPNLHQTPSGRNLKCMFCPFPLISMSSTFSHSLIWSSSTSCIFPCPRSHDEGGEKPFFPLWTAPFLSLSTSLLTPVDPQGIQCHCHIVYSPLQLPDTSGRVRTRGKAAGAGHLRALEHVSVLPTVDAASPDHLEPPPRASRGASTSATRHRAGPLLSPSLSPPATRAQSHPSPPMCVQARGSTRSSPRSLSLSSWTPTRLPRTP